MLILEFKFRRWRRGLLLLTLPFLAFGCDRYEPTSAEVVRPVKTIIVTEGEQNRIRTFPGTVEAARRVELAFRVSGLLAELPVKEGQEVAKGDLIAQLRQDEFSARLADAARRTRSGESFATGVCLPASDRKRFVAANRCCVSARVRLANCPIGTGPLPIACSGRSAVSRQELNESRDRLRRCARGIQGCSGIARSIDDRPQRGHRGGGSPGACARGSRLWNHRFSSKIRPCWHPMTV